MHELRTAGEVIDALGGTGATARLTGHQPQHVSNWRAEGRLPAKTYLVHKSFLEAQGKIARPELWGMVDPAPSAQESAA